MEPRQMVLTEADQAPPPEPTVPEPHNQNDIGDLYRQLVDPAVRSDLAERGIEVKMKPNAQNNSFNDTADAGELSEKLSEVKDLAAHVGGVEKLQELVNMLASMKE